VTVLHHLAQESWRAGCATAVPDSGYSRLSCRDQTVLWPEPLSRGSGL